MTARVKERRAREGPGIRRADPPEIGLARADAEREHLELLKLVDDLAVLAADLWFAGRLDLFPVHKEAADGDDE